MTTTDKRIPFRPEIGVFPDFIYGDFPEDKPVTVQAVEGVTLTFHAEKPIDLGSKNVHYLVCWVDREKPKGEQYQIVDGAPLFCWADREKVKATGLLNQRGGDSSRVNSDVEWIDPQTFRIAGLPVDATMLNLTFHPEKKNLKYQIRLPGETEFRAPQEGYPDFRIPVDGLKDGTIEMKPMNP